MHVILTNGAPFSGKDTFVKNFLKRYPNTKWVRFKDVLYTDSYARIFKNQSITFDEWVNICNDVKLKDYPLPFDLSRKSILSWVFEILVNNKSKADLEHLSINVHSGLNEVCLSPRNELIFESESIIKVKHGQGGVAVRTAENIMTDPNYNDYLYIFSDGGFNIEIETLIKTLGISREDITIIRIMADGCTFEGDSREYINNPDFTFFNDKTDNFFKVIDNEHHFYDYVSSIKIKEAEYNDHHEIYHKLYSDNKLGNIISITFDIKDSEFGYNVLESKDEIDFWFDTLEWNEAPVKYDYIDIEYSDKVVTYTYDDETDVIVEVIFV